MPGPTPEEHSPLSSCGAPHTKSMTSRPRWRSPSGVLQQLAVLAREQAREPPQLLFDQRLEAEQHLRSPLGADGRPAGLRRERSLHRQLPAPRRRPAAHGPGPAQLAGSNTSPWRGLLPADLATVDVMKYLSHRSAHIHQGETPCPSDPLSRLSGCCWLPVSVLRSPRRRPPPRPANPFAGMVRFGGTVASASGNTFVVHSQQGELKLTLPDKPNIMVSDKGTRGGSCRGQVRRLHRGQARR